MQKLANKQETLLVVNGEEYLESYMHVTEWLQHMSQVSRTWKAMVHQSSDKTKTTCQKMYQCFREHCHPVKAAAKDLT
eukprot:6459636-Amphidinium_carterae.1